MPRFNNVIFDLDGLMVDTEPLHRRAFNLLLEACNIDYRFEQNEYGRLITGRSIFENSEYLRERFGLPQTAQEIQEGHRAIFNLLIADAENIKGMPGLGDLLKFLRDENVRLAIASSSRPEQIETVLRGLNMTNGFAALVGNRGELRPKPAPDIYLQALSQLNARPEDTLALEDSISGVRAARNAQIFVIAVPNGYTRNQDLSEANLCTKDLFEVKEYLANSGK